MKFETNQCFECRGHLFFKPLSDSTLCCCLWKGETAEDIDLDSGVSPAIQKHGLEHEPCDGFKKGKSICEPSKRKPFDIHQVRMEGEAVLKRRLGL